MDGGGKPRQVANAAKRDRLGWPLSPAEPVTESVAESGSTIGYWL
jgi:hypothetical protein